MDEISKVLLHLEDGVDRKEMEKRLRNFVREENLRAYSAGKAESMKYLRIETQEKAEYFEMLFYILKVLREKVHNPKILNNNIREFLEKEIGGVVYEESHDTEVKNRKKQRYAILYKDGADE